jgi:hypothetical protein
MMIIDAPQPSPPVADGSMLMAILERAAQAPEFDLERISRLLDLKERWDRAQAERAYAAAMVAFQLQAPTLHKDKHVQFTNRAGTVTEYDHATHYEVTTKIAAALAQHGIKHAWSMVQEQNKITVTCTLTHVAGHKESVSLYSLADDSGGKNSIQAISSATTYLQRYTLLAVTGLSTVDMPDDDGQGTTDKTAPEIAADIWTALNDASTEGSSALAEAWRGLSDTTRAVIVLHYAADWAALKVLAQRVSETP